MMLSFGHKSWRRTWAVGLLGLGGLVSAHSGVPLPTYPHPLTNSVNNAVDANLSWSPGDLDLVVNGGFETGDFAGWTQVADNFQAGSVLINDGSGSSVIEFLEPGPTQPLSGSYHATFYAQRGGSFGLYQWVAIPAGASSATLQWFQRIRNFEDNGVFANDQHFRVQVVDTNTQFVALPFFSEPGDPPLGGWTKRTADLTPFRGQSVQLGFVLVITRAWMTVHLDNIHLLVQGAPAPSYDVYFGTNAALGSGAFLGSTTQTTWDLPTLEPGRTYFWRIIARQGEDLSTGPVWQFTTQKMGLVDHFEWGWLSSPQQAHQPFAVTLTARDAWNNAVTNFRGTVTVSGVRRPDKFAHTILGDPEPLVWASYDRSTVGYSFTPQADLLVTAVRRYSGEKVSIWTEQGVRLVSQEVSGSPGAWQEVLLPAPVTLLAGRRYRVGVYSGRLATNYARFDGTPDFLHGAIHQGYYGAGDGFPTSPHPARWWCVDLTYSVLQPHPALLSPGELTNFVQGRWSGELSAESAAEELFLRAQDTQGHSGVGNGFEISLGSADTDGDGMDDSWELAHGLDPTEPDDAQEDADADGATNLAEYRAGTDPGDAQSVLRFTDVAIVGNDVQLFFGTAAGRTYRVERTARLQEHTWLTVQDNVPGTGGVVQVADPGGAGQGELFYRVVLRP